MDYLILKNVRLSYHALLSPSEYEGQTSYNATFLIEKGSENEKILMDAAEQVIKEKFGAKAKSVLEGIKNYGALGDFQKTAIIDGDAKQLAGYAGNIALRAKRKVKDGAPIVKDAANNDLREGDAGAPYNGCYVHAKVSLWAQDNTQGKTIRCNLIAVKFARSGEPLGTVATADGLEDLPSDESYDI